MVSNDPELLKKLQAKKDAQMAKRSIEEKIVFSIADTDAEGPVLMLGVPKGAWEYMQNGNFHHFDLTAVGFPIKLMVYGGANHDACLKVIEDAAKASGTVILDHRRENHSIKSVKEN